MILALDASELESENELFAYSVLATGFVDTLGSEAAAALLALSLPAVTAGALAWESSTPLLSALDAAPASLVKLDGSAAPLLAWSVSHDKGVANDASDASIDDRNKMFYHEVRSAA